VAIFAAVLRSVGAAGAGRFPVVLALAAIATLVPCGAARADTIASFTYEPRAPLTQQPVSLKSTASSDPDEPIVSQGWDLDGDGRFLDASGPTASVTFARPGPHTVALRVIDRAGNDAVRRESIVVGNRPPVVSIVPAPSDPSPGQPVTFASQASDPDGAVASQAWDLDDDGAFDDASGSSVTVVFPASGQYRIGLRIFDDFGAFSSLVLAIDRPAAGDLARSQALARLMSPFPVVRISGIVRKRGIKLRLLSVNGPIGAKVRLRCRGRGCPFRRQSRTVAAPTRSATEAAPATGLVRIRRFSRRVLRVGATLKVYVTRPDAIGKYTWLKVKKGRPPTRVDRCLQPGDPNPVSCPPG
jgi:plastocyanin